MPILIVGPSTAADWTSTVVDDTVGPGTWPRTVLASFAVASSSRLTVAGAARTLVTTTSLGFGTRYVLST